MESGWRRLPFAGAAAESFAVDDIARVAADLGGGDQDAGASIGRRSGGRGGAVDDGRAVAGVAGVGAAAAAHRIVHGGGRFAGEHRAWHADYVCVCV